MVCILLPFQPLPADNPRICVLVALDNSEEKHITVELLRHRRRKIVGGNVKTILVCGKKSTGEGFGYDCRRGVCTGCKG